MRGLVGRNGAGKTTAMRIVLGLAEPDGGEVRLNGSPIDDAARRRIGYMPEERGLYPKMRVIDQLEFFGQLSGMTAGRRPVRGRRAGSSASGVADRAGDRLDELSLGNQQRVQLAAALVHGPELLVLDEPFSGLDPVGVDVLSAVLREEVDRGAAVVFSSHQLELVEHLCDAVTILDQGRWWPTAASRSCAGATAVAASGSRCGARGRTGPRACRASPPSIPTAIGPDADGVVLELADDADTQRVLDAARAAGPGRGVHAPVAHPGRAVPGGRAVVTDRPRPGPTGRGRTGDRADADDRCTAPA